MAFNNLVCADSFRVWVKYGECDFVVLDQHEQINEPPTSISDAADRIWITFTISTVGTENCDLELRAEVYLFDTEHHRSAHIATFVKVMGTPCHRNLRLNESDTVHRVIYEFKMDIDDYDPDTRYYATFKRVFEEDGDLRYYLFTGITH